MAIRTGATYRGNVPGTDISFNVVWTGRLHANIRLGCLELEFIDQDGTTVLVPDTCLNELALISTSESANNN